MKIIILAGGTDKFLWPLSKQKNRIFLKLFNNKSLFEITQERILKRYDKKDIFISTCHINYKYVLEQTQISKKNIIIAPTIKSNAATIIYSLLYLKKYCDLSSHEIIGIFPSDHYIIKENILIDKLAIVEKIINENRNYILLFGTKPPICNNDNALGYMKLNKDPVYFESKTKTNVYEVEHYIEKPRQKTDIPLNYIINTGIFFARSKDILQKTKKYLPATHEKLEIYIKEEKKDNIKKLKQIMASLYNDSLYNVVFSKSDEKLISIISDDIEFYDVHNFQILKTILSKNKKMYIHPNSNIKNKKSNNIFIKTDKKQKILLYNLKNIAIIQDNNNIYIFNIEDNITDNTI